MMKQFLIIAISFLPILLACGTVNSKHKNKDEGLSIGLEISKDTFDISIHGKLNQVVLLKDKFYFMFTSDRENTSRSFRKMIAVNIKGDFIEDVFLSREVQEASYFDLVVEHDSLFLKEPHWDEETFLLGKYIADFKQIGKRDFSIYHDSSYNVFATDYGEWGGAVFFQDTHTKGVYRASSYSPIVVNKLGNDYYITSYYWLMQGITRVFKITDPSKLDKATLNLGFSDREAFTNEGVETILDYEAEHFFMFTSFVFRDKLCHLYSDKNDTHIGEMVNGKIVPIYTFDFKFRAQFNQRTEEGRQILSFHIPDSESEGVLVIDNGKLNFYFLN